MARTPRVRICCLDGAGRLLVMKWRDPLDGHCAWEPPGGGVEEGESEHEAAVRELAEETGLAVPVSAISLAVERDYRWKGVHHLGPDRFFLARADERDVAPQMPTEEEASSLVAWRFVAEGDVAALDAPLDPPSLFAVAARLAELEATPST